MQDPAQGKTRRDFLKAAGSVPRDGRRREGRWARVRAPGSSCHAAAATTDAVAGRHRRLHHVPGRASRPGLHLRVHPGQRRASP